MQQVCSLCIYPESPIPPLQGQEFLFTDFIPVGITAQPGLLFCVVADPY